MACGRAIIEETFDAPLEDLMSRLDRAGRVVFRFIFRSWLYQLYLGVGFVVIFLLLAFLPGADRVVSALARLLSW